MFSNLVSASIAIILKKSSKSTIKTFSGGGSGCCLLTPLSGYSFQRCFDSTWEQPSRQHGFAKYHLRPQFLHSLFLSSNTQRFPFLNNCPFFLNFFVLEIKRTRSFFLR